MKTVILIRHAKSSWDNPGIRDLDRPLNERGLRDAPAMAHRLLLTGIRPQLFISSPAKRAFSTASFFTETFQIPEHEVSIDVAIYHAWPEHIVQLIQKLPESLDTVAIFGHNPTFTALANMFSPEEIPNVPTCGIVQIVAHTLHWSDFQRETAKVTALLFPKDPVD